MAECTCLCACAVSVPEEAGLPSDAWAGASSSLHRGFFSRCNWRGTGDVRTICLGYAHARQDGRATFHAVAHSHREVMRQRENHVSPRAELDQAHTLSPRESVAGLEIKNDAPRDQAGNLLEHHCHAFAFHSDDVLLIGFSRGGIHGVTKFTALVNHFLDHAGNGRAIYMNVKDIQENADPGTRLTIHLCGRNVRDFAVRG